MYSQGEKEAFPSSETDTFQSVIFIPCEEICYYYKWGVNKKNAKINNINRCWHETCSENADVYNFIDYRM